VSHKFQLEVLKQFLFGQYPQELIFLQLKRAVPQQIYVLVGLDHEQQLRLQHLKHSHRNLKENVETLAEPQVPYFAELSMKNVPDDFEAECPGVKRVRPLNDKQLGVYSELLCILVKLWSLVWKTLLKKVHDLLNLWLLERIQSRHERVSEHDVRKRDKTVDWVHSYQEHPPEITHTLYVPDIRPVDLKKGQQLLELSLQLVSLVFIYSEIHPSYIQVDDWGFRRLIFDVIL